MGSSSSNIVAPSFGDDVIGCFGSATEYICCMIKQKNEFENPINIKDDYTDSEVEEIAERLICNDFDKSLAQVMDNRYESFDVKVNQNLL